MAKSKKKKAALLTRQQIIKKYGITKKLIQDYFPKPEIIHARGRGGSWWTMEGWPEEVAAEAVLHPEIRKVLKAREEREMRERQIGEIMELYASFSPESYLEKARRLQRMFVLHVGPTNSGKTYNAIEDLKTHTPGAYLGPLRLLALEMFDKLNEAGIPCSMLTGEESIPVEGAVAVEVCESSATPAAGLSLVAGAAVAAEVSLLPCAALLSAAPPHAARSRHIMMHSEIILVFFMFHLSLFWSLKRS